MSNHCFVPNAAVIGHRHQHYLQSLQRYALGTNRRTTGIIGLDISELQLCYDIENTCHYPWILDGNMFLNLYECNPCTVSDLAKECMRERTLDHKFKAVSDTDPTPQKKTFGTGPPKALRCPWSLPWINLCTLVVFGASFHFWSAQSNLVSSCAIVLYEPNFLFIAPRRKCASANFVQTLYGTLTINTLLYNYCAFEMRPLKGNVFTPSITPLHITFIRTVVYLHIYTYATLLAILHRKTKLSSTRKGNSYIDPNPTAADIP